MNGFDATLARRAAPADTNGHGVEARIAAGPVGEDDLARQAIGIPRQRREAGDGKALLVVKGRDLVERRRRQARDRGLRRVAGRDLFARTVGEIVALRHRGGQGHRGDQEHDAGHQDLDQRDSPLTGPPFPLVRHIDLHAGQPGRTGRRPLPDA